MKKDDDQFLALLVFVDDIVVVSNIITQVTKIKGYLHELFKINDLGKLKEFLGLEIGRSKQGLHLCQKKFNLDLLVEIGFLECKPIVTPMKAYYRLIKAGTLLSENTSY